jgi:hypothetical protein
MIFVFVKWKSIIFFVVVKRTSADVKRVFHHRELSQSQYLALSRTRKKNLVHSQHLQKEKHG